MKGRFDMKSIWIGNNQNGIEIRPDGDNIASNELPILDELVLYINGKCIMHMEATSKVNYWFGFYLPDGSEAHMNINSKNLKSHIDATIESMG
jgi:hypothetical protein